MFKQRPNLVLVPNLPDRGVKTDLSWLQAAACPAEEFAQARGGQRRPARRPTQFYGIQARNLAKMNAAGVRIVSAPTATGRGARTSRWRTWWPPA